MTFLILSFKLVENSEFNLLIDIMEKLVKKESDSCLDCIFCINTLEDTFCKRFLNKEKDYKGFVYILREERKKSRGKN